MSPRLSEVMYPTLESLSGVHASVLTLRCHGTQTSNTRASPTLLPTYIY